MSPAPRTLRPDRPRRPLARLARDRGGATAVEFAMVAAPFLFMMFAIIELGLVFVISSTLESAAMDAGRLIRTGQLQTAGGNAATFKEAVCERMSIFAGDCGDKLSIDVQVLPQFSAALPADPLADGELDDSELGFDAGGAEDIVLVRAWYRHPLITPFLEQALSRTGDGAAMISASAAFRNEPYQ